VKFQKCRWSENDGCSLNGFFMSRLSATIALAPPDPRSLANVVKRWAGNISRSFMAEKDKEGCVQEKDCPSYRFQVIITNSPHTGVNTAGAHYV